MNQRLKGYLLAIIAEVAYGMNPLFALPCYHGGMNPDSVLLFRYALAIPLMGIMLKARGHSFGINIREGVILLIFGLLMAVSSLTLFFSYNYMAAGIASTLLFVYPVLVALIMWIIFHERMNMVTIASLILALSGIGLLYNNEDGSTLSFLGTVLVFLSSLSYAVYLVAVDKTGLEYMPTLKVTFYTLLFGSLLFVGRVASGAELTVPPADNLWLWGNLFGLAAIPTALSFLCTTAAIKYIGPTPTAILGAFEPLTAIVFGVTVFGEVLSGRDIAGVVLIITAVTMVVTSENINKILLRIRRLFPRVGKGKA